VVVDHDERKARMRMEHETHQQHLLEMIETAQRQGRPEQEIVAMVDESVGTTEGRDISNLRDLTFVQRLIGRTERQAA
jgi:hypothetical protein